MREHKAGTVAHQQNITCRGSRLHILAMLPTNMVNLGHRGLVTVDG